MEVGKEGEMASEFVEQALTYQRKLRNLHLLIRLGNIAARERHKWFKCRLDHVKDVSVQDEEISARIGEISESET